MPKTLKLLQASMLVCAILLSMGGCAIPVQDVGRVVVTPAVRLPPVPVIVQTTEPKAPGYFQQSLVDYFSGSQLRPTK